MRARLALPALLAAALLAGRVAAQSPRSGAPTPGKSLASVDDSDAIAVNPAGLALLPGREVRLQWTGGSERPDRGLAAGVAAPLAFDFSGGLRVDHLRPAAGSSHTWVTGSIAYQYSPETSLGVALGRSYSDSPARDGSWALSPGLLWRPFSSLGLGASVRNLADQGPFAPRSLEAGLLVRPTGRRSLEIGLDALRLERRSALSPRAVVGVALPGVGKLRAEALLDRDEGRRGWTAALGLELGTGGSALSGGAFAGQQGGYFVGLTARRFRDGEGAPKHYVRLRVEGTPSDRSHTRLLRILWRLAESDDVAGVALHLKAEPASSLAHAEELGDALRMLRSRKKKSLCLVDDAGGRALFVCSQADRVFVNPGGGVRFSGMKSQYFYLGGLVEKLGGRAEFVRVADHKTAPEQFTGRGPTPAADADHREMLAQLDQIFLSDLGGGRKISLPELRDRLARGPFTAREARAAGLVDSAAYDDEIELAAAEVEGQRLPLVAPDASPSLSPHHDEVMGSRDRVAIVYIDGDMVDGRSRSVPLIGTKTSGSFTVAAALKAARDDSRVRAVVLRLETPGGSSLAADALWREVALTAQRKPVIASMGSTAASAGYYVASAATEIFANRSTITGSIGIYYGKGDAEALLKKIGVNVATYRSTPRADADSPFRPFTDDERKALGDKIKQLYDLFVDRVARGRRMTPAEVDAVARGKVWLGQQALERRLVDRVGGLREALERARELGRLPRDSPVVELPAAPRDLVSAALELAGLARETEPSALPPHLLRAFAPVAPFLIHEPDVPMARLETFFETP